MMTSLCLKTVNVTTWAIVNPLLPRGLESFKKKNGYRRIKA